MKARPPSTRPAKPRNAKAPRRRGIVRENDDLVQATSNEFEREGMGVAPKE